MTIEFDFRGNTLDETEEWEAHGAAFNSLQTWACAAAIRASSRRAPKFKGPLFLPELPKHRMYPRASIQFAEPTPEGLYAFRLEGVQTNEPRIAPPAYFAIMRALELVPGVRIKMVDETKPERPDVKTYRITLHVLRVGKSAITTPLGRVLFDVPSTAELHERRTRDHRIFAPTEFVLTKWRPGGDRNTREKVFKSLPPLLRRTRDWLPYSASDALGLIAELFEIADRWHWNDLMDRMPDEKPRKWRAAD